MKKTTQIMMHRRSEKRKIPVRRPVDLRGILRPVRHPMRAPLAYPVPSPIDMTPQLGHTIQLTPAFSLNSAELIPSIIQPDVNSRSDNSMVTALVYNNPEIGTLREKTQLEFYRSHVKEKRLEIQSDVDVFLKELTDGDELDSFLSSSSINLEPTLRVVPAICAAPEQETPAIEIELDATKCNWETNTPPTITVDVLENVDLTPKCSASETLKPDHDDEEEAGPSKPIDPADLEYDHQSTQSSESDLPPRSPTKSIYESAHSLTPNAVILEKFTSNMNQVDDVSQQELEDFKDLYSDLTHNSLVNVTLDFYDKREKMDFFIPNFSNPGIAPNDGVEAMILGTLIQEKIRERFPKKEEKTPVSVGPIEVELSKFSIDPQQGAFTGKVATKGVPERGPTEQEEIPMRIYKSRAALSNRDSGRVARTNPPLRQPRTIRPPISSDPPLRQPGVHEYKWMSFRLNSAEVVCAISRTTVEYQLGKQKLSDAKMLIRLSDLTEMQKARADPTYLTIV